MPNQIPKHVTIERLQNGFLIWQDQSIGSLHQQGYVFNTPEELGKGIALLFTHGDISSRVPCSVPDGRLSEYHCSCGSTCYTDGTDNWCLNEKCEHCCVKMANAESVS